MARNHPAFPLLLGALALTALLTGCGVELPDLFSLTAQEWFEMGQRYFDEEDYETARICFENATVYPENVTYADDAQYYLALSYFRDELYLDAQAIFEDLATSFPNSPYTDDARYLIGRCYLERSPGFQRDTSMLDQALGEFRRTLKLFPGSELTPEVEAAIAEVLDIQSRKLAYTTYIYRRMGEPVPVIYYADLLLERFPDSSYLPEVLWRRGEALRELERPAEARDSFQRILDEHPDNPYAEDARDSLNELGYAGEDDVDEA
ncbi:MAG: outer membrane protein assembly factor BamD [Candidatus Coatesbacteria bacterium]|nr:outer membrane protein assembly factor BamD [Candidatus Coatesbacteria bacterium]